MSSKRRSTCWTSANHSPTSRNGVISDLLVGDCWTYRTRGWVHLPGGLSPWLVRRCGTRCRLPGRPGSQQRHFLQASKDILVCSVLIYVQRIRAFTTMRYINLRFTYLLTYLTFLPKITKIRRLLKLQLRCREYFLWDTKHAVTSRWRGKINQPKLAFDCLRSE